MEMTVHGPPPEQPDVTLAIYHNGWRGPSVRASALGLDLRRRGPEHLAVCFAELEEEASPLEDQEIADLVEGDLNRVETRKAAATRSLGDEARSPARPSAR
jgi:hypothetical protein